VPRCDLVADAQLIDGHFRVRLDGHAGLLVSISCSLQ
jgi:hypothetical protein